MGGRLGVAVTSEATKTAPFFDAFFAYVAAFVLVLIFVDWLLGKEGRKRVQDRVGMLWLHAEEADYFEVLTRSAGVSRRFLFGLFGAKPFSFGFVARVTLYSFCVITLTSAILTDFEFIFVISYGTNPSVQRLMELGFLPFIVVFDYISILFSLTLLRFMNEARGVLQLAKLLIVDVAFLLAMTIALLEIYSFVGGALFEWHFGKFQDPEFEGQMFIGSALLFAISMSVPSVLYIITTLVAIGTKATQPVLRPAVSLALRRLYESDKGVLASVSLFFGAVAKAIQEIIKAS